MTIKKRGRPTSGAQLSTKHIIESAKTLMQEMGKVPSLRQLATNLNVDAMAIYHYFKNKDAMLEALAVSLISDIYEPNGDAPWQTELLRLAHSYIELLLHYPGLLQTLLSMNTTSPALVFIERFDLVVAPLQLDAQQQKDSLDLFVDYLHGFALAMNCQQSLNAKSQQAKVNEKIRPENTQAEKHQQKATQQQETELRIAAIDGPLSRYITLLEHSH